MFLAHIPMMGFGSNISLIGPEEVAAVVLLMAKVAGRQRTSNHHSRRQPPQACTSFYQNKAGKGISLNNTFCLSRIQLVS